MTLKPVLEALELIKKHPGKKDKLRLIEESKDIPFFRKVALYAYDHERRFHTTNVEFQPNGGTDNVNDVFRYLDQLATQNGATNADINTLGQLASVDTETLEVIRRIVNKDLRCGASLKSFKTIEPNLQEYTAMGAMGSKDIEKDWTRFMKKAKTYKNICWGIKMDGVRVSYAEVHENGTVVYKSRSGKLWLNFNCFDEELYRAAQTLALSFGIPWPILFDGEVVTTDTDFQKVMGEVRRYKDIDQSILRFVVWSFVSKVYTTEQVYHMMENVWPTITGTHNDFMTVCKETNSKVFRLAHEFDHGWENVDDMIMCCKQIVAGGDEGLVAKICDSIHEDKRSVNWFKCKALYIKGEGIEVDLPVLRWIPGKPGTRLEDKMGKLICDYNGVEVGVGTGYDDEQRERFMTETPEWIEVHADSETKAGSLRLPVFQRVRDDK